MSDVANSRQFIQIEACQTTQPVGQAQSVSFGGAVNYCLTNVGQVGDIQESMLTESQFQSLSDTTWVLADGRSVVGSDYQTITGNSNIPDLRGTYLRMKDNGRGLDSHGDVALGTYEADQLGSHNHSTSTTDPGHDHTFVFNALTGYFLNVGTGTSRGFKSKSGTTNSATTGISISIGNTGGSENNPKTSIVNYFIKIKFVP